jgi:hypothetical protein
MTILSMDLEAVAIVRRRFLWYVFEDAIIVVCS